MRRLPTVKTPIPPPARPIVEAAHRRYDAACKRGERPAIADRAVRAALLTAQEYLILASCGYYPIPEVVIRLGCTPAEHQRREVLEAVAEQLPDAVLAVLETFEV
jgi:hypothetical protein